MITQKRLKELFSYDEATGVFTRLASIGRAVKGQKPSYRNDNGYVQIRIDYKLYRAHHLAWLYVTGEMPRSFLDHIDGNRSNNSFSNLRTATCSQNGHNRGAQLNNKIGIKGVSIHKKSGKYRSSIVSNCDYHYLGLFDCPAAAHFAYQIAADKYHGEFARAA